MSQTGFDPEILQDFLTESGELLEQLEADLVVLETDPRNAEILNKVFRALHTIKGSASFLALTNLIRIAHASESALNAARNGLVVVDRAMMDLLLQAVDIIKVQMGQLREGAELAQAPSTLVEQLAAIGEGKAGAKPGAAPPAPAAAPTTAPHAEPLPPAASAWTVAPLRIPNSKKDLLDFLVSDVDDTLNKIQAHADALARGSDPRAAARNLGETSDALSKAVEFFEIDAMTSLARALAQASEDLGSLHGNALTDAAGAVKDLLDILHEQSKGLRAGELRTRDASDILARLKGNDAAPQSASSAAHAAPSSTPATAQSNPVPTPAPKPAGAPAKAADDDHAKKPAAENTIRVDVSRLESLMNLVGELVLQKNRIAALARRIAGTGENAQDLTEAVTLAAGGLDRVTGDIQTAVMRTRMQPLDKLFGKYPRLIRDLAAKTGKQLRLVVEGGETEVDKSVIEELGDPLVHLLRNSTDHGIEPPDERVKAGKPPEGTITLRASHEGSHVRILVMDDGRGLLRDRIVKKAVEKGLCTKPEGDALPDRDVFKFIFGAGFSTAEKVSDLSGRGVGMDVVRTNIEKIKGSIELDSAPNKGTTIAINIPLTVAILPAMMVGVADEIYAVPLGNILEIVKPLPEQLTTIGEHPVMRLRDSVLPLISAADAFAVPGERPETPFAVVLATNEKRIGLMVSRLIGQQEIVIKPLDGVVEHRGGAVSGATVRDDGGVSLIADVAQLMHLAETLRVKAHRTAELITARN